MSRTTELALPPDIRAKWLPPPRLDIIDWCRRYAWIPKQAGSPAPGRWNPSTAPYQIEPLLSIADPDIERVVFQWATQVGKTLTWNLASIFFAATDPGPQMIVAGTQDSAKDLSEMKLQPMLAACAQTRDQVPPPHEIMAMRVDLTNSPLYFAWSGSVSRIGEKSIRFLWLTELDLFDMSTTAEGDSQKLAEQRVKAFMNAKILCECSPSETGTSRIQREYGDSDRRRFHVPCPFCGSYQPLDFQPDAEGRGGLRWDDAKGPDGHTTGVEAARDAAYYACNSCFVPDAKKPRIRDHHKPEMLRAGVWVPEGLEAASDGKAGITFVGDAAHPTKRVRGYRLSSLYSPFLTFGQVVQAFLECGHNPELLKTFHNKWLALPWEPRRNKLAWEELRERLKSTRPRGTVPDDALFLTGAMDVQLYSFYWSVVAWCRGGRPCLVADGVRRRRGVEHTEIARAAEELLLAPAFPQRNGEHRRQVVLAAVDTGYHTNRVYAALKMLDVGRVVGVKGAESGNRDLFWRMSNVEVAAETGKPFAGSQKLYIIDTDKGKRQFHATLAAVEDPDGNPIAFEGHDDMGEDFMRQITSESLEPRLNKRTGRTREEWVLAPGEANHFLDTIVYQFALADMVGIWEMDEPLDVAPADPPPRVEMHGPEGYWS